MIRRLRTLFPAPFGFDPLTDDQVKTVRGAIHREGVVKARPASVASVAPGQIVPTGAITLDVLDPSQEGLARSLGDGPLRRLRHRRIGQDDAHPRPRPDSRLPRSLP